LTKIKNGCPLCAMRPTDRPTEGQVTNHRAREKEKQASPIPKKN